MCYFNISCSTLLYILLSILLFNIFHYWPNVMFAFCFLSCLLLDSLGFLYSILPSIPFSPPHHLEAFTFRSATKIFGLHTSVKSKVKSISLFSSQVRAHSLCYTLLWFSVTIPLCFHTLELVVVLIMSALLDSPTCSPSFLPTTPFFHHILSWAFFVLPEVGYNFLSVLGLNSFFFFSLPKHVLP